MSQKDAQVQKAKQLHDAIQQMTEQTETLEAELAQLAAEKAQVDNDLVAATNRARDLQAQLPQKATGRADVTSDARATSWALKGSLTRSRSGPNAQSKLQKLQT